MNIRFYCLLAFSAIAQIAAAQISEGGTPPGLLPENQALIAQKKFEPVALPQPDMAKTRAEDDASPFQNRFAVPVLTDVSPATHGVWLDLPGGQRLWRCELTANGAKGLVLLFDKFRLPAGGLFFAYGAEKQAIHGAFTEKSCRPDGKILIGPLPGETAVLEYLEPAAAREQAEIHLNRVDYAYHQDVNAQPAGLLGFGDAVTCHTNVNCQVATNYYRQKRGVARILMVFSNGTGWCSGTLVANTSETDEPYFLTAHHCQIIGQNPDFSMWRFDFNFESPSCQTPATAPTFQSVLGCERLAYRTQTDVMLLKINPIPQNYGVYFSGWDRSLDPPTSSALIHHPRGDIKKYSADAQPAEVFEQAIDWGPGFGTSPANTHFKTIPETGTFEPGSSGCPLFDETLRVVGQLHGGNYTNNNPCFVKETYFGIFGLSWDAGATANTRLKDWLDPTGLNKMTQDGYFMPTPPPPTAYKISGKIETSWGVPMPDVRVNLSGGATRTTLTDGGGNFTFDSLPVGLNYTLTPAKDTNDLNGLSSFDLLNITKHILGIDTLDSPWKIIASDANLSNTVSSFDVLEFRKTLLGLYPDGFPAAPAWRFFPANAQFTTPAAPFPAPDTYLTVSNLAANKTDVKFYGIKLGDTNNSANAGQ